MATYSSIFSPIGGATLNSTTADLSGTITATSSTIEIDIGPHTLFAINANGDVNIRFGNSGMPAAAATDFRIPSGTIATYEMNRQHNAIRLYNPGSSSITYWIQPLSRT